MTAVQWALDQQHTLFALKELGGIDDTEYFHRSNKILEQAKEMENERLTEAYRMGRIGKSIKEFNETFKSL